MYKWTLIDLLRCTTGLIARKRVSRFPGLRRGSSRLHYRAEASESSLPPPRGSIAHSATRGRVIRRGAPAVPCPEKGTRKAKQTSASALARGMKRGLTPVTAGRRFDDRRVSVLLTCPRIGHVERLT